MKKSFLFIIILAIVFVALLVVFLAINSNEDPSATGVLYTIEEDGIKKVEIVNEYGEYAFEKKDKEWMVNYNDIDYRTNQEKIDLLLTSLQSVPIERVLDEELKEYGFDNPRANITVTDNKGNVHSFLLGNETASRSSVYLRDEKTKKPLITSTAAVAQLTGSIGAYRAKDVLRVDGENIRNIDFIQGDNHVLTASNTDYKNWFLDYPFVSQGRKVVMTEFVAQMYNWKIAEYPTDETLEEMGLNKPSHTLNLTDDKGNKQTLLFGKDDGTTTYVQTGENEYSKLYSIDIDFSTLTPEQVMFVAPLSVSIDEVAAIKISIQGEEDVLFTVEHGEGIPIVQKNGKEIDFQDFSSIFTKYITLNATGYDPKAYDSKEEAVATLTTTLKDGTKKELVLLNRDDTTLYMLIDGKTEFFLNKSDLEKLSYRINKVQK